MTMKNAAKCDTQCELQNTRVIRSLNAIGGGVKTFMFVSVWKGITNLNAIEVKEELCFSEISLVKRDGWQSNRRQNEVVTFSM